MLRILLIVLMILGCGSISGQGVAVKKSTDMIVIKGKSYYLHVVDEGETLYSICKAYGVDVDTVKEVNKKADDSISLFEVLKIPYVKPYVERDKKYYYHKVEKGETLYSIARHFNIKVRRILKENPQYERNPLPTGAVVRLPLKDIEVSKIPDPVVTPPSVPTVGNQEEVREIVLTDRPVREKEAVPVDTLFRVSAKPTEFMTDISIPDNKYVRVVVLLPLFASDNLQANQQIFVVDTLNPDKQVSGQILRKTEQFLYFYEGILLAADSLRREGYKIDMHIFDTEKNSAKTYHIAGELNRLNPDLIIGPVYGSEFRIIAENLINKNIPMVYPLSSRAEDFSKYPNFLQVNPSFDLVAEEMMRWILRQTEYSNVIGIRLNEPIAEEGEEGGISLKREKNRLAEKLEQAEGKIQIFDWDSQEGHLEGLRLLLQEDKENIIILPEPGEADVSKVLPALTALADVYRITVVGLPEWQNFLLIDHETFYKLNVKLFTYSYIDSYREEVQTFSDTYRKYFSMEPHTLTFKAYDMGLYFIPLAAKYGDRMLEGIKYADRQALFSVFRFLPVCADCGLENNGLFIVNYSSDYTIKMEPFR